MLTKAQVVARFKEVVMPGVRVTERFYGNGKDVILRSEAWNNYVDALSEDGEITREQCDTWTHPAICN